MSNTLRVIFCCRGFDTGMYVAARLEVTEATSFASPAITRMLLILKRSNRSFSLLSSAGSLHVTYWSMK